MTEPLPETAARTLSAKAVERIVELLSRMDAVALGPGVGLDPETQAAVQTLVRDVERPMVVDADALTALAGRLALCRDAPAPRLLTPHPGEAARLLGCGIADVQADRIASARRLAAESGAVVALKGARTVVASPDGRVAVNPTGNPGMATGGTGDVLTGIAGGLLAQGVAPAAVLSAAVYLHGLAGDLAAEARGEAGLLAGDVADALPAAIRRILQAERAVSASRAAAGPRRLAAPSRSRAERRGDPGARRRDRPVRDARHRGRAQRRPRGGKTCFIQGLAAGLGVEGPVTSPDLRHDRRARGASPALPRGPLPHREPRGDPRLGLEELLDGAGVTAIEWAEKAELLLPLRAVRVRIRGAGDEPRTIEIAGAPPGLDRSRLTDRRAAGRAAVTPRSQSRPPADTGVWHVSVRLRA